MPLYSLPTDNPRPLTLLLGYRSPTSLLALLQIYWASGLPLLAAMHPLHPCSSSADDPVADPVLAVLLTPLAECAAGRVHQLFTLRRRPVQAAVPAAMPLYSLIFDTPAQLLLPCSLPS
jgi:hypothetical protein